MAKNLTLKKPGSPVEKLVNEMTAAAPEKSVKNNNVKVNASVKSKVNVKKTENQEESVSSLFVPKVEKEIKSRPVNIRVKETVWADFEYMRRKLGYSQSDFFEIMVKLAKQEMQKAE